MSRESIYFIRRCVQGRWVLPILWSSLPCRLLTRLLLLRPNNRLFVCCWLHTIPSRESRLSHVNYFVNPHISFNCCEFVYLGDQIELGETEGGCQRGSARTTDDCISNPPTMGATARHADSISDLNECTDASITLVRLMYSSLRSGFQTCVNDITVYHQTRLISTLHYAW